ncbi:MAG: hypothetical protein JSR82_11280 [Verrucomicrobia bacterium]|nr:hypothetical protein [Verrucomicrobiota bacterium]
MPQPAWWIEALELERRDELAAAEQKVQDALPHLGCYAQLAHLYELRLQRKLAEGDRAAAEEAARRSNGWMRIMASGATSGGEGLALSAEADEHEARLDRLLQAG